jgi:hypothetical protein
VLKLAQNNPTSSSESDQLSESHESKSSSSDGLSSNQSSLVQLKQNKIVGAGKKRSSSFQKIAKTPQIEEESASDPSESEAGSSPSRQEKHALPIKIEISSLAKRGNLGTQLMPEESISLREDESMLSVISHKDGISSSFNAGSPIK